MKSGTKSKSRGAKKPARRSGALPAPKNVIIAEFTTSHASFYRKGESEPFSRLHNGPEGSEAAVQVAAAVAQFKAEGFDVLTRDARR